MCTGERQSDPSRACRSGRWQPGAGCHAPAHRCAHRCTCSRGEEARAASQQGLRRLWLSNPFLLLPPGCVGTPAVRIYWQDLCPGGGPGPISLCALWLFPKVVPLMMTRSSQPHAWCMDMGLMGTRTKRGTYFHLVTLRTTPGLHRMKGLSCLALGSPHPPAVDGNSDTSVCGHGMAKSPPCVAATLYVQCREVLWRSRGECWSPY